MKVKRTLKRMKMKDYLFIQTKAESDMKAVLLFSLGNPQTLEVNTFSESLWFICSHLMATRSTDLVPLTSLDQLYSAMCLSNLRLSWVLDDEILPVWLSTRVNYVFPSNGWLVPKHFPSFFMHKLYFLQQNQIWING